MLPEVMSRLLVSVAVIGGGLALYWLVTRFLLRRASARVRHLESIRRGSPAILYFSTPTCAPCKTIQRPAIQSLQRQLGKSLQVVEIDASVHPEVADEWGILTVPTTFLIDAKGQPRRVNYGVATKEKLVQQLKEIIQ